MFSDPVADFCFDCLGTCRDLAHAFNETRVMRLASIVAGVDLDWDRDDTVGHELEVVVFSGISCIAC